MLGAKARRETRGCHNRSDHPELDPALTVNHHVSAILRKLAVPTRGQAAVEAARLGIGKR